MLNKLKAGIAAAALFASLGLASAQEYSDPLKQKKELENIIRETKCAEYIAKGERSIELKRYDRAEECFSKAIGFDENPTAYAYLAIIHLNDGRCKESISDLEKTLELDPNMYLKMEPILSEAYFRAGLQEARKDNADTALSYYQKAYTLNRKISDRLRESAKRCLDENNHVTNADFRSLIEASAKRMQAVDNIMGILTGRGELGKAIEFISEEICYDQKITGDFSGKDGAQTLSMIHKEMARMYHQRASLELRHANSLKERQSGCKEALEYTNRAIEDYDTAFIRGEQFTMFGKRNAYETRAMIKYKLGDNEGMMEDWKETQKLDKMLKEQPLF